MNDLFGQRSTLSFKIEYKPLKLNAHWMKTMNDAPTSHIPPLDQTLVQQLRQAVYDFDNPDGKTALWSPHAFVDLVRKALDVIDPPKPIVYSEMVAALAKPGKDIGAFLVARPSFCHALHMAVGISGEAAEMLLAVRNMDPKNMLEEAGDLEFYIEGAFQMVTPAAIDLFPAWEAGDPISPHQAVLNLVVQAGHFLDLVKKQTIYEKEIGVEVYTRTLVGVRNALKDLYQSLYRNAGITISQELARDHNIQKLGKRYREGKYTNAAAIARNDKPQGE